MKENKKNTVFSGKVTETLFALVENIRKVASDGRVKKAITLLALLFACNVAKGFAEEIVGTILAKPRRIYDNKRGGFYDEYGLATQDDLIADMYLQVFMNNKHNYYDTSTYTTLFRYLNNEYKVVFEDNGLKLFDKFESDRLIAIIFPDGREVELTRLFSLEVIKRDFPYLYAKLVREGRAK